MSEETGGAQQEIEIGAGDKKFKLRGSDLLTSVIGMIVCSGLVLLGYVLYEHKTDAKGRDGEIVTVIKEMTGVAKEGVVAQREMNCLISLSQELREKNTEFCKRMAR
mgnify:CR=1 FL=1